MSFAAPGYIGLFLKRRSLRIVTSLRIVSAGTEEAPGAHGFKPVAMEAVLQDLFGAAECAKMRVAFLKDVVAPSGLVQLPVIHDVLLNPLLLAESLGICFESRTNLVTQHLFRHSYVTVNTTHPGLLLGLSTLSLSAI